LVAGKGYAIESAKSVIDYAFKWLKFNRLTTSMDQGDIASQKVFERLAFKLIDEREVDGKQLRFYELVNEGLSGKAPDQGQIEFFCGL